MQPTRVSLHTETSHRNLTLKEEFNVDKDLKSTLYFTLTCVPKEMQRVDQDLPNIKIKMWSCSAYPWLPFFTACTAAVLCEGGSDELSMG